MAQKALSHPWITQLPGGIVSDMFTQGANCHQQLGSPAIQFCGDKEELHQVSNNAIITNFSASNTNSTVSKTSPIPLSDVDLADNFIFYTGPTKCSTLDASSMLSPNPDYIAFEEPNQQQYSGFSINLQHDMQQNIGAKELDKGQEQLNQWETIGRTTGFPFSLPPYDAWKASSLAWDSPP